MRAFPDEMEVQGKGCGALYSLSLSNKVVQRKLADCGATGAILTALHRFANDASMAISAAEAIMSMSCDLRENQDMLGSGMGASPELEGKGACELLAEVAER